MSATKPAAKALVLGERGISDLIASELRQEGFDPVLQYLKGPLPSPFDGGAAEELRALIEDFSRQVKEGDHTAIVHPGISIWAERPELTTLTQQAGLVLISPPARALALFSDKLSLMLEAERQGLPTLTVGSEPLHSTREIEALIQRSRQSFPFVLKAVRGGGSFRLLVIHSAEDLSTRLPLWLDQLRKNLGDVILFVERYLQSARHIVVPFARFKEGRFKAFPSSDASLQCRHRKMVEFCPPDFVDESILEKLVQASQKLADAIGYVGVGVFEFLVDGDRFFFIDGLARLNTNFHLWEKVSGTSAVSWQLAAQGLRLTDSPIVPSANWKSAVALRIYAEDSMLQLPQPGAIYETSEKRFWEFEDKQGELWLSVRPGDKMDYSNDGAVGFLHVGAGDRQQAVTLARQIVEEFWIAGSLQTNDRFIAELLDHPWVREGMFHAGFIDEEFLPNIRPSAEITGILAAIPASLGFDKATTSGSTGIKWAVGDHWTKPSTDVLKWVEGPEKFKVGENRGLRGKIRDSGGGSHRVLAYPLLSSMVGSLRWQVRVGSWVFVVRRVSRKAPHPQLLALVGGKVHSLLFQDSARVVAHEPLVVLESLGMLVPHAVPIDVYVRKWHVSAEQRVEAGQVLADLELLKN